MFMSDNKEKKFFTSKKTNLVVGAENEEDLQRKLKQEETPAAAVVDTKAYTPEQFDAKHEKQRERMRRPSQAEEDAANFKLISENRRKWNETAPFKRAPLRAEKAKEADPVVKAALEDAEKLKKKASATSPAKLSFTSKTVEPSKAKAAEDEGDGEEREA